MAEPLCGGEPCNKIVDRLGLVMADQQKKGFESLEKLMIVYHAGLHDELHNLKADIKSMGDEIFPRLREAEGRIRVLDATIIKENNVEDTVNNNENIIWLGRFRSRVAQVVIGVLIVVILSIPVWVPKVLGLFTKDAK